MTIADPHTISPGAPFPTPRRGGHSSARRPAWTLHPVENRPVAAVLLSGALLQAIGDPLQEAGLAVLEIPADVDGARRLLAAGAGGPGRVLLVPEDGRCIAAFLRAGVDEMIELPWHPLQVTAAALRVGGAPEWQIARWSERAFSDLER
jgi:hypothetical protein